MVKKTVKLILALVIGFVIAMIIMSIAIYFGYTNAYSTEVEFFTVRILGIPIYGLSKTGTGYVGVSNGICMGMFCGICMAVAVAITTIIERMRHR